MYRTRKIKTNKISRKYQNENPDALVLILAGHGRQFPNSVKNEKLERRLHRT